jgi:DNA-directed RNA polymerase subunit RPC12/RpoP
MELKKVSYVVYCCGYCQGKLSIPANTPRIRFEFCPVCGDKLDSSARNAIEALIEIIKVTGKGNFSIILEGTKDDFER